VWQKGGGIAAASCNDQNNFVMQPPCPGEGWKGCPHPKGEHRRYSVIPPPSSVASALSGRRDCKNIAEVLHAVKHGRRVSEGGGKVNWTEPSFFVPAGCNIPYHTPEQVERVLQGQVEVYGDSFTRHNMVGLILLLTGNMFDGATAHAPGWENCTCDGVFSEHEHCRSLVNLGLLKGKVKLCERHIHQLDHETCIVPTQKCDVFTPRFFWLQGGPHYHSDPVEFLTSYLRPKMEQIRRRYAKCKFRPFFLITGLDAQERGMDKKYPHQSRKKGRIFNNALAKEFAGDSSTLFVDFLRLSHGSMSCEGYHKLTEVNIVKSNVFLSLIGFLNMARIDT